MHNTTTDSSNEIEEANELDLINPISINATNAKTPDSNDHSEQSTQGKSSKPTTIIEFLSAFFDRTINIDIPELKKIALLGWVFISVNLLYYEIQLISEINLQMIFLLLVKIFILSIPLISGVIIYKRLNKQHKKHDQKIDPKNPKTRK